MIELDRTALVLEVLNLREKLVAANSTPCECCKNMSESVDSLEYQVEQFKLHQVQVGIALQNLQTYTQVKS